MLGAFFSALSWKAKLGGLLGIALLIAAVFGGGYFLGSRIATAEQKAICAVKEEKYNTAAARLRAKLAIEQGRVDTRVVTQYKDRIITRTQQEIRYVQAASNVVPTQSVLSVGWVRLHNDAATGSVVSDTSGYADGTASGITDTIALERIVRNYSAAHANAEQLKALQQWVRDSKAAADAANASPDE